MTMAMAQLGCRKNRRGFGGAVDKILYVHDKKVVWLLKLSFGAVLGEAASAQLRHKGKQLLDWER